MTCARRFGAIAVGSSLLATNCTTNGRSLASDETVGDVDAGDGTDIDTTASEGSDDHDGGDSTSGGCYVEAGVRTAQDFVWRQPFELYGAAPFESRLVRAIDVDGDRSPDVSLVSGETTAELRIMNHRGASWYVNDVGFRPTLAESVDLSGGGFESMLLADTSGMVIHLVSFGSFGATEQIQLSAPGGPLTAVRPADLDEDGADELLAIGPSVASVASTVAVMHVGRSLDGTGADLEWTPVTVSATSLDGSLGAATTVRLLPVDVTTLDGPLGSEKSIAVLARLEGLDDQENLVAEAAAVWVFRVDATGSIDSTSPTLHVLDPAILDRLPGFAETPMGAPALVLASVTATGAVWVDLDDVGTEQPLDGQGPLQWARPRRVDFDGDGWLDTVGGVTADSEVTAQVALAGPSGPQRLETALPGGLGVYEFHGVDFARARQDGTSEFVAVWTACEDF